MPQRPKSEPFTLNASWCVQSPNPLLKTQAVEAKVSNPLLEVQAGAPKVPNPMLNKQVERPKSRTLRGVKGALCTNVGRRRRPPSAKREHDGPARLRTSSSCRRSTRSASATMSRLYPFRVLFSPLRGSAVSTARDAGTTGLCATPRGEGKTSPSQSQRC